MFYPSFQLNLKSSSTQTSPKGFSLIPASVFVFNPKNHAKMTWISIFKGKSGFAASSTAEDVTKGVDGTGLTAIVTGNLTSNACLCVFVCSVSD